MQNGTDDKLDNALENTFPASDPVSITPPDRQQDEPGQQRERREARQSAAVKQKAARAIRHVERDYLWLSGAFMLGCMAGLAARSSPAPRRDPTAQLQKKLSRLVKRLQH